MIEIACAARADYVPHTAAMLHSVLAVSHGGQIRIHFLHGADLPESDKTPLAEMVDGLGGTISFRPITDDEVAGLRTRELLPASHWYRIFLPELLPDADRVLYLDGDLIALESLEPLWTTPLGDHYLAAVTNVFMPEDAHRPATLELPADQPYFNSGVLLMNLERMRRDGCTAALLDYAARHHERLSWPEQDALNVVLGAHRLPLNPRWNLMNSIVLFPWSADVLGADAVAEAQRHPAIRHFEGPGINKPWHYLCDRSMRHVYFEHRRQTPWPDIRLEGRSPANVLRRWARELRRHSDGLADQRTGER